MQRRTVTSALGGASLFAAGWFAACLVDGSSASPPSLVGAAVAQSGRPSIEQTVQALMYGVATMAVDTEAAAQRIAELGDRHAALERRVAGLEAQIRR